MGNCVRSGSELAGLDDCGCHCASTLTSATGSDHNHAVCGRKCLEQRSASKGETIALGVGVAPQGSGIEINLKGDDPKGFTGLPQETFDIEPDWLQNYLRKRNGNSKSHQSSNERPLFPGVSTEILVEGPGRPPFEVCLVREGKNWRTLGLIVSADGSPRYLVVEDIWQPSLISEWNALQEPSQQVQVGDKIVAINECSGDSIAMLSIMQSLGKGASVILHIES